MFETLVTGLLTRTLGNYIDPKCFSKNKINVAVWSGYVVLTELEVKPEVVADLPAVTLVRGLVGSLELKIPWNRLQSDSVVATVDDVYLLLRTEEDVDAVMRQMDEFQLKKKLLEELYAQAKIQDEVTMVHSDDGFAARLVNKIIDNLELHIRRIHIRIEDHQTGEHPFALGLTIESVHIQSTNANWQPSYIDTSKSNDSRIFKSIELNHLSVYCNPDCKLQRDCQIDFQTCSAEDFSSAFSCAIPKRFDDRHLSYYHRQLYPISQQHHFLLKPVDASARLIVNRDVFDTNVPKFEVDVNISEIAFRLEESQYCDLLYLVSVLQTPDHYVKYQRHRKFRPQTAVFDEPVDWWKYAITAVIEDVKVKKQQWTWEFMKERRKDRKRYTNLWHQKSWHLLELADVNYGYFDSDVDNDDVDESGGMPENDDKEINGMLSFDGVNKLSSFEIDLELEEIERRRSIEEVLVFRYLADLGIRKFQALQAARARRRLPTPPTHESVGVSDTESVDKEFTEYSVPAEVRYRSWGAWVFGWTSKLATTSPDRESERAHQRIIPEVELRELFNILEEPSRRSKKRMYKHRDVGGKDDRCESESQMELSELYRVTVTLQRGSVTLASDSETNKTLLRDDLDYGQKYDPTDFLLGIFSQLQVAVVARDETMVVDVSLQSIEAFDESAESSAFSRFLRRKQTVRPTSDGDDVNVKKLSGVVFLVSFEMNPVSSNADASLFVHMEPLEIVLSPTARCWGRLAQFIDTPVSLGLWEELQVASLNDIVNLRARTQAKLDYVMQNRIALAVDLRIQAPVVIIPESDSDYDCARLVVDLGRVNFRTDRLSRMNSDRVIASPSFGPLSSRSGHESLSNPYNFQDAGFSNTSFVQQLYDEAERGEGAIRWKEEFYDKFSLSVANIHVLLFPYGRTNRAQGICVGDSSMNYSTVSAPSYLADIYNANQEYEVVERFNINVTVRTSILPLDATLTRVYIHADLPALTFNLSLKKYFQLVALGNQFSLANTEVPKKSRNKYSDDGLCLTEDASGSTEADMVDANDRYETLRKKSFLSTATLKKFMLDGESADADALPDDLRNDDEILSVESDDTWFSLTSGNPDVGDVVASGETDDQDRNLFISTFADAVTMDDNRSVCTPSRCDRNTPKRRRSCTSRNTLKKPRSSAMSSYSSYPYDMSDFGDDFTCSGTIVLKLQGFRVRIGHKTLSTQVNVSLISLDIEDVVDASGRSTHCLLFSSPTIAAPFPAKAPLRRGEKFSGYAAQRRQLSRKRERVISFQFGGAQNNDGSRLQAPDTVLKVGISSLKDQKSGNEILRDVDVQLGSVQLNFDQTYVCSLLELFEESIAQLASTPISLQCEKGSDDKTAFGMPDDLPPPLKLTPTINQEYSLPVSLTESVRADLELARKNLFEKAPDPKHTAMDSGSRSIPIALKLNIRLHCVSVYFSDRGKSIASAAILDSAVHFCTGKSDSTNVSGIVGDVKVFDLTSRKSEEDGLGVSSVAICRPESPALNYIEILGLDSSAPISTDGTSHVLSIECLIATEKEPNLNATADVKRPILAPDRKSSIVVSVQPVRVLAQPEFVESMANYVVKGSLRAYFLSKQASSSTRVMERKHNRTNSLGSELLVPSRFSPILNCPQESLTPFFNAIDPLIGNAKQVNFEAPSVFTFCRGDAGGSNALEIRSENGDGIESNNDSAAILAHVLDNFDLDIKLCHPCVVLPAKPLSDIQVSPVGQPCSGMVLNFGTISFVLRQDVSKCAPTATPVSYEIIATVDDLQITSLANQIAILDRSGFQMRGRIPAQATMNNLDNEEKKSAISEIAVTVDICPICINASEKSVCLALDIYYNAIVPIYDVVHELIIYQDESYERASVADSAYLPDHHKVDCVDLGNGVPCSNDTTMPWQLTIHILLEEFKISLISYSEAPHQFETWMKSVLDFSDEMSLRESSGGASSAAQKSSYPQRCIERQGSYSNEIASCLLGEIVLIALEANMTSKLKDTQSYSNQLQCDFFLGEAIICDKIADSSEFLTQLFGLVPEAHLECMEPRTSSFDASSYPFANHLSAPLLRHATSPSSKLDAPPSQLSGRLISETSFGESVITTNSLHLSIYSARFLLLPRTVLRFENFVLDLFLAASKKKSDLELERTAGMTNNLPGIESPAFDDAGVDISYSREDRQDGLRKFSVFRSRSGSISEPSKDDSNAVRSTFMSPLQCVLNSTSVPERRSPGSSASRAIVEETESGMMGTCKVDDPKSTLTKNASGLLMTPRWKIDISFSNLQMWVVSTDRRIDVTGCMLDSQLVAKFDNALGGSASSDCIDLVTASVEWSNLGVSIGSPIFSATEQQKRTHHRGTLVEKFDVNVQFALRQCFQPAHEDIMDLGSIGEENEGKDDSISDHVDINNCVEKSGDDMYRPKLWINSSHTTKNESAVYLPNLFIRDVPPEWQEWLLKEPTVCISQIVLRMAYRNLPLLLKISAGLTSMLDAEKMVRDTFAARLQAAAAEDLDWADSPDTPKGYTEHAYYFEHEGLNEYQVADQAAQSTSPRNVLTRASVVARGIRFQLINNIDAQASPVIEFDLKSVELLLRSESNLMIEVKAKCNAEATYQNLRLVAMEPLIEPWSVKVKLCRRHSNFHGLDDTEQVVVPPWKLDISSDVFLQLNLTDALIANMVAADRAWRWVVNAGGDSREMTEYSTYWIRNNTGMSLRYWGASYNEHLLAAGDEEPLRISEDQCEENSSETYGKKSRYNTYVRDHQLYIAVKEEHPGNSLTAISRQWQSEAPIPVDQADSRMYALVDLDADIRATNMRKCECVIDVLVEHGCKYFVVRSTLILENQTASDLEVEFIPPQRRLLSQQSRVGDASQGHIIPIWKKVVKTSSIVPVPMHIVSSGECDVMVRPLETTDIDAGGSVLPKAYAKEKVHLPLFEGGSFAANDNMTNVEADESGQSQCNIKFRRLYSDRPVRPFMMSVCLSNASGVLYYRTLSFHSPLIVHNLTAGPLDFCLATPSVWSPAVEAKATMANARVHAGWETCEQRLRERGTINVADSLTWHLSSEETPLELSIRIKGFDWSEPTDIKERMDDLVRIKMKDLVSDAHLYITAEIRISKGRCRELFLFAPYWIVNLTGLKLEFEYEEERMGRNYKTRLLAGQKRLGREELLLTESQRTKTGRRDRNPHLLHPILIEDQESEEAVEEFGHQRVSSGHRSSPAQRESERERRHPRLLPSVSPVKGLLDLLPKVAKYDTCNFEQLEVLQACHSDYEMDRGCVRLRISNERSMDARKGDGQQKWSDFFVLDLAGTIGEIEADDYGVNRKFSIGYSITSGKGQYSRTKVIMLTPRFILINTMSSAIEVCHSSSKMMAPTAIDMANASGSMTSSQAMSTVNPVVRLDAGAYANFHWTLRFAKTRTIRCRFAECGWSWSGAVPLVESGEYAVRMRHESTRESKLVRVTLKLESSCVCVYFREERTTAPPYRVENYSLETLRVHQHRVRLSEVLLPHHSLEYAWDEPTEERLLVVDMLPSAAGDNSRPLRIGSFDLDKIHQYPDALGGTLGIEISTDGPTRVLRFTDTRLRGKKTAPVGFHGANNVAAMTDISENSAMQVFQRFVTAPTVHVAMRIQGLGISIVDSAPKELVYMSISAITLEFLLSEDNQNNSVASVGGNASTLSRLKRETRPRILACCLELSDVQVDNQLQMTPYPVLLRFSNPNGRPQTLKGQKTRIPVLQVGLVKHEEYAGIEFIRHFSVSVLPVHIRVDGALLYQILPLLVHAKIVGNNNKAGLSIKKRAVVLAHVETSCNAAAHVAHCHLLFRDFNASLEIQVKALEAAKKDGAISAQPSSCAATHTIRSRVRMNSGQQQQPISSRHKEHTALAAEIQHYSAAKYDKLGAIAAKDEQKKLYFEEFHIDSIRATVSFSFGDSAGAIGGGQLSSLSHTALMTDPSSSRGSPVITVGPLRLILNAIGTSLSKIANAPFQLQALHIQNSFIQPDALASRLASHYQSEALRQAYVILGSVDVLGNPMIAWKNLRSGFHNFISEPVHGLSQRSPQAFAFGVGRGSLSLVRASVYTFLDFYTRILTAFSLGLSEACLKLDDYTGYPATRHIFQGLVQGVSGVVVAPIHSFEVNGVRGVLPGLVAGVFGVVLKPLLGFSLATATTAATLRDAIDPNTKTLLVRVRPPRHIDLRTKRLKVYSYVESLGEEIVGKIRGGRYRADGYLGHVDLKASQQCFLVTRKRILFLNVKGTAPAQAVKYDVQWELLAEEVVMVDCSRILNEQSVTIYYMEDEFRAASGTGCSIGGASGPNAVITSRRRTPGTPRGMLLQKHEVALPDTKLQNGLIDLRKFSVTSNKDKLDGATIDIASSGVAGIPDFSITTDAFYEPRLGVTFGQPQLNRSTTEQ